MYIGNVASGSTYKEVSSVSLDVSQTNFYFLRQGNDLKEKLAYSIQ